jgi:hypothetical protein
MACTPLCAWSADPPGLDCGPHSKGGTLQCPDGKTAFDCQKTPQPQPSCASRHSLDNSLNGLEGVVDKGETWRQLPTFPGRMKAQSAIQHLTIHFTGVRQNPGKTIEQKLQGLARFSENMYSCSDPKKTALWGDIPYNFYIDMNGNVAKGRDVNCQDDTNTDYNPDGHLTIVVEATLGDTISDNQSGRLYALMRALQLKYNIPTSKVGVHNDYTKNTDCPGPEVSQLVRTYVAKTKGDCAKGKYRGVVCR